MTRPITLIIVLLMALSATTPTVAQSPPQVIHTRAYTRGDCSVDDTAGFQAAIDAWRAGQASRSNGELHIDAGCYQTFGTLQFAPWGGQVALFGNVVGDGPEVTVIQGVCGVNTMRVWDYKYGEFGGFKLSGRCGASNQGRNTDLNHTGLMLGSAAPQMGTNGGHIHNITMEHYAVGLSVGDFWTSGSTAEMKFSNIGISQSHIGVMLAGFNTLDNAFHVLNVAETDIGVYSDTAYTTQFYGGSGSNNWTTFYLAACCEWIIDGWREEYGANTQYWIQYASPASDNRLAVRGSNTVDTFNPHRAFAEAIHPLANGGSNTSLLVQTSLMNGAVGGKRVVIVNSAFTNGQAVAGTPGNLTILGSCLAEINAGQCTYDIPNQSSGLPADNPLLAPRGTPTSTPMPVATSTPVSQTPTPTTMPSATPTRTPTPVVSATATPTATPVPSGQGVRWNAHGPLPGHPAAYEYLWLDFTNLSASTLRVASDRIEYVWTQDGQYVSSDTVALPQDVAPGATLHDEQFAVATPAMAGNYLLRITLAGSNIDLPVTLS